MSENEFFINPSEYELTSEELDVLMEIPEWHRALLLKWPVSRIDLFSEYFCGDEHPYFYREIYPTKEAYLIHEKLNLIVVKRSIKKIIEKESLPTKLFYNYLNLISPYRDADEMTANELGELIFPLSEFSNERAELVFDIGLKFKDGLINMGKLGKYAEETSFLMGIGAASFYIWGKYIKENKIYLLEKKEENNRCNDYFMKEIYESNYKDLIKQEGLDNLIDNGFKKNPQKLISKPFFQSSRPNKRHQAWYARYQTLKSMDQDGRKDNSIYQNIADEWKVDVSAVRKAIGKQKKFLGS